MSMQVPRKLVFRADICVDRVAVLTAILLTGYPDCCVENLRKAVGNKKTAIECVF